VQRVQRGVRHPDGTREEAFLCSFENTATVKILSTEGGKQ
jgi:hypothetical protein